MKRRKFRRIAWFRNPSKAAWRVGGFTLIELLVGIILAFLVITPLLGFVVSTMNTDRQEQAKVSSEQELQAAMEYIARDLQQAMYIYDQAGVAAITGDYATTVCTSATATNCSQLPTDSNQVNQVPVLVFWKRKMLAKALPISNTSTIKNDAFVYSLVAYYLIKDTSPTASATWSGTTRIGRFEIQDGVTQPDGTYVNDPNDPRIVRDQGFKAFDPQNITAWKKADGEDYTKSVEVLADYIDQSIPTPQPVNNNTLPPVEKCPVDSNAADTDPEWTQVPDYTRPNVNARFKTYSFYTCVYSSKNTARVFLRGNALARIDKNNPPYSPQKSAFFPSARIEVKGVGSIGG